MPHYHLLIRTNLLLLLAAFTAGLRNLRQLDIAARIFLLLIGVTLLEEVLAYYWAVKFHDNTKILRLYSIIEIVLLSLYFNFSIKVFQKYNVGFYVAGISLLAGIADIVLSHYPVHFGGLFMYFTGTLVIIMAITSLFQLVKTSAYLRITVIPHFWFAVIQLLFSCCTILIFAFYNYFTKSIAQYQFTISYSLFAVNYLSSIGFAVIFLLYPKMRAHV
ncbi:MAG: hypothetical protein JST19_06720 [Bacteroidetes bacterium]|nr:hypothetical protein [Bacteroidota bacterium]